MILWLKNCTQCILCDKIKPYRRCKNMARPRKEIDQEEFEKLCALQCTQEEICAWFDVTDKTLTGWCKRTYNKSFSEIFAIKRERGKVSLRRRQFKLAERSAAMAIFLGKNYLNQSDKVVYENHDAIDRLDDILEGVRANATNIERKAE